MRPGSGLSRRDAPTHVQSFPNLLDDLGHERFEIDRRAARDDALIGHNRFIAPIAARIDYIGLDPLVRGQTAALHGSGLDQKPWRMTDRSHHLARIEKGPDDLNRLRLKAQLVGV